MDKPNGLGLLSFKAITEHLHRYDEPREHLSPWLESVKDFCLLNRNRSNHHMPEPGSENSSISQKLLEFYSDLKRVDAILLDWRPVGVAENSSIYGNLTHYRNWALVIVRHVTSQLDLFGNLKAQSRTEDVKYSIEKQPTICEKLAQAYLLLDKMYAFFQHNSETLIKYFTEKINQDLNIEKIEKKR